MITSFYIVGKDTSPIPPTAHRTTVFNRISSAALIEFSAPQVRRLIEGGAYSWGGLFKNCTLKRNLVF